MTSRKCTWKFQYTLCVENGGGLSFFSEPVIEGTLSIHLISMTSLYSWFRHWLEPSAGKTLQHWSLCKTAYDKGQNSTLQIAGKGLWNHLDNFRVKRKSPPHSLSSAFLTRSGIIVMPLFFLFSFTFCCQIVLTLIQGLPGNSKDFEQGGQRVKLHQEVSEKG